jgi:hypothetical protein
LTLHERANLAGHGFSSGQSAQRRPVGVTVIAAACLIMAGLHLGFALLTWTGAVALAEGAFLLGAGLETYGPVMFLIFGFLFARAGYGLLRISRWSRYLAVILAALGIYLLVPSVSSAVVDLRIGSLALGGLQVIARVAVIWYLAQPQVKDAFG